ncbi:hypothetical protein HY251_13100 [bacterium]|nr:hypothetical protein [bacterium]
MSVPGYLSVKEARDVYLRANGFTLEGYTAPTFELNFFGKRVSFKNRPSRMRVVPFHDLHHVATGYGTDFTGEAEIGAWELRAGCNSFLLRYLNGFAALIGLVIAPLRTLRAWRRARGHRSLYVEPAPYDELLGLSVSELRSRLGVPEAGQADREAGLHRDAPRQPEGAAQSERPC